MNGKSGQRRQRFLVRHAICSAGAVRHGEKDYRAYLSWLGDLPRFFAQQTDNMRAGLKRGFTPPAVVLTGRDKSVESIATATDPTKVAYYAPFEKLPASIPAARQAELRAAAKRVIVDRIIPAHKALLAFLRTDYFPGATKALAASAYPTARPITRAASACSPPPT